MMSQLSPSLLLSPSEGGGLQCSGLCKQGRHQQGREHAWEFVGYKIAECTVNTPCLSSRPARFPGWDFTHPFLAGKLRAELKWSELNMIMCT